MGSLATAGCMLLQLNAYSYARRTLPDVGGFVAGLGPATKVGTQMRMGNCEAAQAVEGTVTLVSVGDLGGFVG